jgi:hypothetical protein
VLGPVFKTGEGSGDRLLVGSIPMRSRHYAITTYVIRFAFAPSNLMSDLKLNPILD